MSAPVNGPQRSIREQIITLVKAMPDADLPKWKEDDRGCLWFKHLSMGWTSASHPENMSTGYVENLLAAEAAGREFVRRRDAEVGGDRG